MKLTATVKEIELDAQSRVIAMKGSCKAKDLRQPINLAKELGLDWVYC